jgi:hypothetical protein
MGRTIIHTVGSYRANKGPAILYLVAGSYHCIFWQMACGASQRLENFGFQNMTLKKGLPGVRYRRQLGCDSSM